MLEDPALGQTGANGPSLRPVAHRGHLAGLMKNGRHVVLRRFSRQVQGKIVLELDVDLGDLFQVALIGVGDRVDGTQVIAFRFGFSSILLFGPILLPSSPLIVDDPSLFSPESAC